MLASEKSVIILSDIYNLKCECDSTIEILDSCLPGMKSRTHEFTNGGTRCQSVIMISKLDFVKLNQVVTTNPLIYCNVLSAAAPIFKEPVFL